PAVVVLPGGADRKAERHRLGAERARAHAGVFSHRERRGVGGVDRRAAIIGVDVHILGIARAGIVVGIALALALRLILVLRVIVLGVVGVVIAGFAAGRAARIVGAVGVGVGGVAASGVARIIDGVGVGSVAAGRVAAGGVGFAARGVRAAAG